MNLVILNLVNYHLLKFGDSCEVVEKLYFKFRLVNIVNNIFSVFFVGIAAVDSLLLMWVGTDSLPLLGLCVLFERDNIHSIVQTDT